MAPSGPLAGTTVTQCGTTVEARGKERARKLGRTSSRGPQAPIVVYNNPARSRGQTRSPRRRTGCSNCSNNNMASECLNTQAAPLDDFVRSHVRPPHSLRTILSPSNRGLRQRARVAAVLVSTALARHDVPFRYLTVRLCVKIPHDVGRQASQ
ncbi:hypothetical protein IEO21_07448 [Rhodonia placenta]|uniref:Uncharacterized protein n=1 Tax=Rhodonia placenta TaxID=104341 RepID=A0A8H7TZN0_9APHY|nr:hypothetical protein IEO21_07448 [Postia placenta]